MSDALWAKVSDHLPVSPRQPFLKKHRKGGRPRLSDRTCFEAMLWLIREHGTWRRLPKEFGRAPTVRKRLYGWWRSSRLDFMWQTYLKGLSGSERLELGKRLSPGRHRPFWLDQLARIYALEFAPRPLTLIPIDADDETLQALFPNIDFED